MNAWLVVLTVLIGGWLTGLSGRWRAGADVDSDQMKVTEWVLLTPFEQAFLVWLKAKREHGEQLSDWQLELLLRFYSGKTP